MTTGSADKVSERKTSSEPLEFEVRLALFPWEPTAGAPGDPGAPAFSEYLSSPGMRFILSWQGCLGLETSILSLTS